MLTAQSRIEPRRLEWEKRNVAAFIPQWDPTACIQSGNRLAIRLRGDPHEVKGVRWRRVRSRTTGKVKLGSSCRIRCAAAFYDIILTIKGDDIMGVLCRIGKMIVNMRYFDTKQHHKPHVHVVYNGSEAVVAVDGEILASRQAV